MATKNDIFKEHLSSYLKSEKQKKGDILKHVCFVTGMHRKAAIRKFTHLKKRSPYNEDQRGRAMVYTPEVTAALKDIWEAGNEVCGELLYPVINEYITILQKDGMWTHANEATRKLREMSEGTLKRRVAGFMKIRRRKKGISATKPSHLKHIVPVFSGPWTDNPPGYGQLDTVMHSDTALGDAVYTVNYTDAATCLVIPRAQWNKGQEATKESMKHIKEKMPFSWLGAHPDTGSEFLNWLVKDWCDAEKIDFSRSRPGRKNDNMYVEERNGHVIRKIVGYIRLDCKEAVRALNDLYDVLTPYLIHFVAVRRTLGKEKVLSKYKRTYEKKPKTPYQQILEHPRVSEEVKEKLMKEHSTLNPLVLKKEIDRRLAKVYDIQKRFGNLRK